MTTPSGADEFALISRYLAPLAAGEPGAFALGDDAAVLDMAAHQRLVVTTDTLVAGVHFPPDLPAGTAAARLLRVNLSDLAAMGAEARAYTLSLALPRDVEAGWIEAFAAGLGADQAEFGVTLVGGDTVATPGPLTLTLTALGTVAGDAVLRRNGARAGDTVYVSGAIGDGALGLAVVKDQLAGLDADSARALTGRYHRPEPRLTLGRRLHGLAHAAADVSDGLVADLGHICAASGVEAEIDAARVPLSAAGRRALSHGGWGLELVLSGGDDYELVFTAPPAAAAALAALALDIGLPLTAIGGITGGTPGAVRVLDGSGREMTLARHGYQHFRDK